MAEAVATTMYAEPCEVLAAKSNPMIPITEVYEYRVALLAHFLNTSHVLGMYDPFKYKLRVEESPGKRPNCFLVGATLPAGPVHYYFDRKDWDLFHIPETNSCPQVKGIKATERIGRLRSAAKGFNCKKILHIRFEDIVLVWIPILWCLLAFAYTGSLGMALLCFPAAPLMMMLVYVIIHCLDVRFPRAVAVTFVDMKRTPMA